MLRAAQNPVLYIQCQECSIHEQASIVRLKRVASTSGSWERLLKQQALRGFPRNENLAAKLLRDNLLIEGNATKTRQPRST